MLVPVDQIALHTPVAQVEIGLWPFPNCPSFCQDAILMLIFCMQFLFAHHLLLVPDLEFRNDTSLSR